MPSSLKEALLLAACKTIIGHQIYKAHLTAQMFWCHRQPGSREESEKKLLAEANAVIVKASAAFYSRMCSCNAFQVRQALSSSCHPSALSNTQRAVKAVGTARMDGGHAAPVQHPELGYGSDLLDRRDSAANTFGMLGHLQGAVEWAAAGASELSLHRSAFLLEMLRRTGGPEGQHVHDLKQATYYVVPAIVRSMGMCLPSPDAWQALVELCAESLHRLYKIRSVSSMTEASLPAFGCFQICDELTACSFVTNTQLRHLPEML